MNLVDWLISVGTSFIPVIVLIIFFILRRNWIAELIANKILTKQQHELNKELASHESQLRLSELLYQEKLDATKAFVSLYQQILPPYSRPDMEWDDACDILALQFEQVEKMLDSFIVAHKPVLNDTTLELLENAKSWARDGNFSSINWGDSDDGMPEVSAEGRQYAGKVMIALEVIENKLMQVARLK